MTLSLGIMSGKKQNLLLLMIICCALCQISTRCTSVVDTCQINFITSSSGLSNGACKVTPIKSSPVTLQGSSDNLIIQVNSSDQCFWNSSSSTVPDIKRTCLSKDEETITLNISSLVSGQCKLYSFNITKDNAKQEIRMNETVEGIKLWSVSNGCIKHINNYFQINCIPSSSCKFSDVYLSNDNQITSTGSSDNLIIQVNSSDHCFWNRSSSTAPDIKWTCLSDDEETITLNISSLDSGQCRSYSFSIKKDHGNYEIRMNETVEAITLWLVPNRCIKNTTTYHQSSCINSSSGIFSDVYLSNDNPITYTGCGYSKSEEKCTNLVYNQDICRENEGSKYILKYNQNNEWTCVTCFDGSSTTITPPSHTTTTHNPTTSFTPHNTIQNPSTRLTSQTTTQKPTTNFTSQSTTPGYTDPAKASEALDKLGSKLEEMEKNNTSNAAIVMGDVIGLVHVQAKNTETKEINICYSSDQAMVVVNQSDMNTNCSWSTKISKEALNKSRLVNNGTAFVGVLRFYNMTNKNENYTVLNKEVYGITMRANISNLTDNIDMYFRRSDKVNKPSCSSWNGKGELNWTTSGCDTEIDNTTIKCSCSHLTFFAVLMSPPDASNNTVPDLESLTLISSIGCGISMFFLAIALFMHFLLRKAKSNQATKILMNMFVALSLLNASFLSNESVANTGDNAACVFIALLLHYSMLASFTWFFIQALHMYLWLIRQNVSITNYMRKITVLGWVFPAPAVIAIASVGEYKTVIIKSTSEKISRMCWITNSYIHYIVNIGYYALVFIFTTGIFIMIVTKVVQARNIKAVDGKRKTFRKQLMMVLSLFLLFGLTWSVAFFSYGPMLVPSYYIFTVLNSFQGFFLFLYYYHIHNDVAGSFSDDPENTDSNTTITQSSINAVDNIYH